MVSKNVICCKMTSSTPVMLLYFLPDAQSVPHILQSQPQPEPFFLILFIFRITIRPAAARMPAVSILSAIPFMYHPPYTLPLPVSQPANECTKAVQQYVIHIKGSEGTEQLKYLYAGHKQKGIQHQHQKTTALPMKHRKQKTEGYKYNHISHQIFKAVEHV